jgi:GMP synthase-like glutamine amidotransferase
MKPLLIVKNVSREGPGLFETVLNSHRVRYRVVDLDKGETFPSPAEYSALVVLGGPDSANDTTEKIKNELSRIQEALTLQIPYLGVCLGLQMLVKAGGGTVLKNPVKEIGFRDSENNFFQVDLTPEGADDPICQGIEPSFKIFQLHGETVSLTGQMTLLGAGTFCRNQLVRMGAVAYGIQGHLELTERLINDWIAEDADLKTLSRADLEKDFKQAEQKLSETGIKFIENFLKISGLI